MDEAMVERVKRWVSGGVEAEKREVRGSLAGVIKLTGYGYFRPRELDGKTCQSLSNDNAWYAQQPRAPRANKAKHAEKVEGHLDQARFWETAAAMLKAAKVKTLGELLED
jgi:hypothetical protein